MNWKLWQKTPQAEPACEMTSIERALLKSITENPEQWSVREWREGESTPAVRADCHGKNVTIVSWWTFLGAGPWGVPVGEIEAKCGALVFGQAFATKWHEITKSRLNAEQAKVEKATADAIISQLEGKFEVR